MSVLTVGETMALLDPLEDGPLRLGYLCGEAEAELLWRGGEVPVPSVIHVGARGAIVDGIEVPPLRTASVVDEVGAGDAFAAGFAYGLLHGWGSAACARAGNVIAAGALAGTGDWETLPRLEDVQGRAREELTAIVRRPRGERSMVSPMPSSRDVRGSGPTSSSGATRRTHSLGHRLGQMSVPQWTVAVGSVPPN